MDFADLSPGSRREEILAVMRDDTLDAQGKKRAVRELVRKGSLSPTSSPTRSPTNAGASPSPASAADKARIQCEVDMRIREQERSLRLAKSAGKRLTSPPKTNQTASGSGVAASGGSHLGRSGMPPISPTKRSQHERDAEKSNSKRGSGRTPSSGSSARDTKAREQARLARALMLSGISPPVSPAAAKLTPQAQTSSKQTSVQRKEKERKASKSSHQGQEHSKNKGKMSQHEIDMQNKRRELEARRASLQVGRVLPPVPSTMKAQLYVSPPPSPMKSERPLSQHQLDMQIKEQELQARRASMQTLVKVPESLTKTPNKKGRLSQYEMDMQVKERELAARRAASKAYSPPMPPFTRKGSDVNPSAPPTSLERGTSCQSSSSGNSTINSGVLDHEKLTQEERDAQVKERMRNERKQNIWSGASIVSNGTTISSGLSCATDLRSVEESTASNPLSPFPRGGAATSLSRMEQDTLSKGYSASGSTTAPGAVSITSPRSPRLSVSNLESDALAKRAMKSPGGVAPGAVSVGPVSLRRLEGDVSNKANVIRSPRPEGMPAQLQRHERDVHGKGHDDQATVQHKSATSKGPSDDNTEGAVAQVQQVRPGAVAICPPPFNDDATEIDIEQLADLEQPQVPEMATTFSRRSRVASSDSENAVEKVHERVPPYFACIFSVVCCIFVIAIVVPVVIFLPGGDSGDVSETSKTPVVDTKSPTSSPTNAPTTSSLPILFEALDELYETSDSANVTALRDPSSAQFKAAVWASADLAGAVDKRKINRYLLAVFYYATIGEDWAICSDTDVDCSKDMKWLVGPDECKWFMISCDDAKDITEIAIPTVVEPGTTGLAGTLPFELSFLSKLEKITLPSNRLGGPFPFFENLPNLTTVDLSDNEFTGTIPENLFSDRLNIKSINGGKNMLNGSLPLKFTSNTLKEIRLSENTFTGTIPPQLRQLKSLNRLELAGNKLTGSIPSELFSLPLVSLYLNHNYNLGGTIPERISQLSLLRRFDIRSTAHIGTLPSNFFELTNLEDVRLANCSLSGPLPDSISNLEFLEVLHISGNEFTGVFPSETFSTMRYLRRLDMTDNSLTGSVSKELCEQRGFEPFAIQFMAVDCTGASPKVSCDCCRGCTADDS